MRRFPEWARQSVLNRPTATQPCADGGNQPRILIGPLRKGFGLPRKSEELVGASIIHLLHFCSPTTIAGHVMRIAVNAINRVLLAGARPKIGKKLFKVGITKLNTPATIMNVHGFIWILAAFFGTFENLVFSGFRAPVSSHTLANADATALTAATSSVSTAEIVSINNSQIATRTASMPQWITVATGITKNGQVSVGMPGSINETRIGGQRCKFEFAHGKCKASLQTANLQPRYSMNWYSPTS